MIIVFWLNITYISTTRFVLFQVKFWTVSYSCLSLSARFCHAHFRHDLYCIVNVCKVSTLVFYKRVAEYRNLSDVNNKYANKVELFHAYRLVMQHLFCTKCFFDNNCDKNIIFCIVNHISCDKLGFGSIPHTHTDNSGYYGNKHRLKNDYHIW